MMSVVLVGLGLVAWLAAMLLLPAVLLAGLVRAIVLSEDRYCHAEKTRVHAGKGFPVQT